MTDKIMSNMLRFPAIRKRKLNPEGLRQQLALRDSTGDRIRLLAYVYTGITPNIRDMETYTLPKGWYFLYYFLKPYRILFTRKSKSAKGVASAKRS